MTGLLEKGWLPPTLRGDQPLICTPHTILKTIQGCEAFPLPAAEIRDAKEQLLNLYKPNDRVGRTFPKTAQA